MASKFIRRLEKRIQQVAAEKILFHLNDPRIGFVTVTKVEVLPDLSRATVFVSVYGHDADARKTMRALDGARGLVQRAVGAAIRTRITPTIRFAYDDSIAKGIAMEQLIKSARSSDSDKGLETRELYNPPAGTKVRGKMNEDDSDDGAGELPDVEETDKSDEGDFDDADDDEDPNKSEEKESESEEDK